LDPLLPVQTASGTADCTCIACGGTRFRDCLGRLKHSYVLDGTARVWEYHLVECTGCGLGFVNPLPTPDLIPTLYPHDYGPYADQAHPPEQESRSPKYALARFRYATFRHCTLSAKAQTVVGMLAEALSGRTITYTLGLPLQLPTQARIFELGYGSGHWLLAMNRLGFSRLEGFDIEANKEAGDPLRCRGIQVTSGDFLKNEYPKNAYDCIRMEHVLEHLPDPIAALRKCREMLTDDGILLVNIPCKDSWSVRISLRHFCGLDLPRHLFHHTPKSLRLLLASAGFSRVDLKVNPVASNLAATVNSLLKERQAPSVPNWAFAAAAPLYRVLGQLSGKGDMLTACARVRSKSPPSAERGPR
jgi:SAM-dependent methyltransferase